MSRQLFKSTYLQLASYLSRKSISNPSPSTNLILNKFIIEHENLSDGYNKVTADDLKKYNIINISFENWCINMHENSILIFKNIKKTEDFKNTKQKEYFIKFSNIISQYLIRAHDEYNKENKGTLFCKEHISDYNHGLKINLEMYFFDQNYQQLNEKIIRQDISKLNKSIDIKQKERDQLVSQINSIDSYIKAAQKALELNEYVLKKDNINQ